MIISDSSNKCFPADWRIHEASHFTIMGRFWRRQQEVAGANKEDKSCVTKRGF